MNAIFNLFQGHLTNNSNLWKIKRHIFHLFWGLLNITLLILGTNYMVNTNLEFIWFTITLAYASIYWILSNLIIDSIIGDEIDNEIRS